MQKDIDLFKKVNELSSDYSHKFIMGDLNADLSLAADADAHTIRTLAKNLNLKLCSMVQLIDIPRTLTPGLT